MRAVARDTMPLDVVIGNDGYKLEVRQKMRVGGVENGIGGRDVSVQMYPEEELLHDWESIRKI